MSDPITAAELKKLRREIEGHGCGAVQADTVLRLLDLIDRQAAALRDDIVRRCADDYMRTLRAENERMAKALDYGERLLKFVPQAHDILATMKKMRSGEYEREMQAMAEKIAKETP